MNLETTPSAWVRVSPAALRHNLSAVCALLAQEAVGTTPPRVIAVVKANAFGHGAGETARIFHEAGADFFAVTTAEEALELRAAGVTARILLFLPPLPEQIPALLKADVDVTVCDLTGLSVLTAAAGRMERRARVHLKIDTGMGRLGALPEDALPLGRLIAGADAVQFAGIYTHFARALERDPALSRRQFALFEQTVGRLRNEGIDVGLRHCANSAAMMRFPEMRLDAVRPGTILYGQYPGKEVPRRLELQETWKLQARIVALREVPQGTAVGYGGEHVTRRASRLAMLPIGYAEGFTVAPASASAGWRGVKSLLRDALGRKSFLSVSVRGQRAPILGRVAMQICTADVTDIPGVQIGDIVDVPSRRITTSARLPRVYED